MSARPPSAQLAQTRAFRDALYVRRDPDDQRFALDVPPPPWSPVHCHVVAAMYLDGMVFAPGHEPKWAQAALAVRLAEVRAGFGLPPETPLLPDYSERYPAGWYCWRAAAVALGRSGEPHTWRLDAPPAVVNNRLAQVLIGFGVIG